MPTDAPARVIPDGHAEVTHIFSNVGDPDPYTIRYGVECAATDVAGLTAVRDAAVTAFLDAWSAGMSENLRLVSTTVRGSVGDGGLVIEGGTAANGEDASEHLPSNCALVIEKRTSLGGRQNKGRMYLPAILDDEGVNAVGTLTPATVTNMQSGADQWYSDLIASAPILDVVIFHADFIRNPAVDKDDTENPAYRIPNPNADTPTNVTAFSVDPVIGTQRRRLR